MNTQVETNENNELKKLAEKLVSLHLGCCLFGRPALVSAANVEVDGRKRVSAVKRLVKDGFLLVTPEGLLTVTPAMFALVTPVAPTLDVEWGKSWDTASAGERLFIMNNMDKFLFRIVGEFDRLDERSREFAPCTDVKMTWRERVLVTDKIGDAFRAEKRAVHIASQNIAWALQEFGGVAEADAEGWTMSEASGFPFSRTTSKRLGPDMETWEAAAADIEAKAAQAVVEAEAHLKSIQRARVAVAAARGWSTVGEKLMTAARKSVAKAAAKAAAKAKAGKETV